MKEDVEFFASKGLRTLVFGYKEMKDISIQGIESWDDVQISEVESDLTLVGVTGVEDLLQENVARCIEDFRAANIKVWMLTGDKGGTAKEIGKSCGLITIKEIRKDSIIASSMQIVSAGNSKLIEIAELTSRTQLKENIKKAKESIAGYAKF